METMSLTINTHKSSTIVTSKRHCHLTKPICVYVIDKRDFHILYFYGQELDR